MNRLPFKMCQKAGRSYLLDSPTKRMVKRSLTFFIPLRALLPQSDGTSAGDVLLPPAARCPAASVIALTCFTPDLPHAREQ